MKTIRSDRRMGTKRQVVSILSGLIAALLGIAGVAWACSPTSSITLLPESGPAGMKMTLEGRAAVEAGESVPVEIHWNSVSGPVLGSVTPAPNGEFSTEVTVPQAAPGVYYLVAVAGNTGAARAPFELTAATSEVPEIPPAPEARSVSADTWLGFSDSQGDLSSPASVPAGASSEGSGASLVGGFALLGIGLTALSVHLILSAQTGKTRSRA